MFCAGFSASLKRIEIKMQAKTVQFGRGNGTKPRDRFIKCIGYFHSRQISCSNSRLSFDIFILQRNGNIKLLECTWVSVFLRKTLFAILFRSPDAMQSTRKRKQNRIKKQNKNKAKGTFCVRWVLVYTAHTASFWIVYVECHCNLFVCDCRFKRSFNADFCLCK